ncbi:MAG: hypothetical protein Q8K60_07760, partial [Parachlamydiaceae bacterium]|nr:hypothetical protein [Parachlamydiaceae bacterium]
MMNYLSKFDISKTTTFTNHFSHYNDSDKNRLELTYESKYNVVRKNANVYIKIINKGFIGFIKSSLLSMNYKFIKYKTDDKIIFININSLSKRLGISKKNISKVKSNQKQLDLLIKNHHEKYIETEKKIEREIDTECEKALKNYQQNNTKLSNSNGSHLSINTLRKAISNAVISKFDVRQKEIVIRSKKGKIIHIKKQENNETPLITLFTKKLLGQGAYGRVEVTQDLLSGKTTVAKIALDPFSKKDARNEYEILKKLENEDQTGLQKRPYLIFDFDFNYDNYYGYLAPKYDNSLQSVMDSDLSSNEKLECARQILKGLVTLKKQQICHGDI